MIPIDLIARLTERGVRGGPQDRDELNEADYRSGAAYLNAGQLQRRKFLIVEGDFMMAETLMMMLSRPFPKHDFDLIHEEAKFREWLNSDDLLPDVIVMGVWFKWCSPDLVMPEAPPEVVEQGYHLRAGYRCTELLRANSRTAKVPVLLYHSFTEHEMRAQFQDEGPTDFCSYSTDSAALIEKVRALMARK
jgi:DNA-binding NarL/FixJ family response regulator